MTKIASVVRLPCLNPNCGSQSLPLSSAQYRSLVLSIVVYKFSHYWKQCDSPVVSRAFPVSFLKYRQPWYFVWVSKDGPLNSIVGSLVDSNAVSLADFHHIATSGADTDGGGGGGGR